MLASTLLIHFLLVVSLPLALLAKPVPSTSINVNAAGTKNTIGSDTQKLLSLLCDIKFLNKLLFCSNKGSGTLNLNVSTPLGIATGVGDTATVGRFVVKYASAGRWQQSVMSTTWQLPNNSTDPSQLPDACPQPPSPENSSPTDEDCLSMIIYVPATAAVGPVPALMWIHGGSFILGSATGPGLDGAALATATNSIVAVIQYRLGAFGFLNPNNGQANLAVGDAMTALKFLQKVLPSFNGNPSKITIAGQSSGATMVRALLSAPSASSLFNNAILQSDPMDFGFLSPGAFQSINNFFTQQSGCDSSDYACLSALSTDDVLQFSLVTFSSAASVDASAGTFEPLRPVRDGSLINNPMDLTAPFPSVNKKILISTVLDEAGPAIFGTVDPDHVPASDFVAKVNETFGEPRTDLIVNSSFYPVPGPSAPDFATVDVRPQIVNLGTDQIWRCSNWAFARLWASHGGTVYVGEYVVGATYPDNAGISFCTQGGTVCHEDDIEIVFGTVPSPNAAQAILTKQMQARYKAFMASGNPNVAGEAAWSDVSGSNVNALVLGGSGTVAVNACEPSFWGQAVPFDYQVFGA